MLLSEKLSGEVWQIIALLATFQHPIKESERSK
jgi:hypothetical protein